MVRNRLPMQETRMQPLVQEDPHFVNNWTPCHNHWACAIGPENCNYRALCPRARSFTTRQVTHSHEKHACSYKKVAPADTAREKACTASLKTQHSQKENKIILKCFMIVESMLCVYHSKKVIFNSHLNFTYFQTQSSSKQLTTECA